MSLPSIWRPSRELIADARTAAARGDAATACRLAFAATMHASTRGADGNEKYALSEDAIEAAMEIFTGTVAECDFPAISARVNEEISSDRERPATGPSASRQTKQKHKKAQASLPLPTADWAFKAGQRVRIEGLSSRSDLNGCTASVLSFDAEKEKYAVRVDNSDECVRLTTNRVVALAPIQGDAPPVSALVDAATAGKANVLRKLIRQGGDVNGTDHGRSGRPASAAAAHGHLECLRILLDAGAGLDMPNAYGSTPMHDAAYSGELGCVTELLKRGASPNPTDANGNTPIVAACAAGHVSVVKTLLEYHATVNSAAFGANRAGQHGNQEAIESALLRTASASDGPKDPGEVPRAAVKASPSPAASQAASGPLLPLGSICTIHGVKSKPELNGDFAVVESPPEDGRYQVAVPLGHGKALRIKLKGDSLTPAPGDASAVDPRELPSWPGLALGEEVLSMIGGKWTGGSTLQRCFMKAIPQGTEAALTGGMEGTDIDATIAEMLKMDPTLADSKQSLEMIRQMAGRKDSVSNVTPHTQWMWSLLHLVKDYECDNPPGCFRFLLAHAGTATEIKGGGGSAECLIIDVLTQPLACPRQLPVHHTQWEASPGGRQKRGVSMCEPLLSVRYWHIRDDDEDHSKRKAVMGIAGPQECAFTRAAIACKGDANLDAEGSIDCIQAESLQEVRTALAMLEANHRALSGEYRGFFDAASAFHGEGKFRASFLIPAPHPAPTPKAGLITCTGCGAKQAEAEPRFQTCGRCKTHFYCSATCQQQHWKVHKKVCDKSTDEIREVRTACPHDRNVAHPILTVVCRSPFVCVCRSCQRTADHLSSSQRHLPP